MFRKWKSCGFRAKPLPKISSFEQFCWKTFFWMNFIHFHFVMSTWQNILPCQFRFDSMWQKIFPRICCPHHQNILKKIFSCSLPHVHSFMFTLTCSWNNVVARTWSRIQKTNKWLKEIKNKNGGKCECPNVKVNFREQKNEKEVGGVDGSTKKWQKLKKKEEVWNET